MEYSFCQTASFTHKSKFYVNKEESAIMDQKEFIIFQKSIKTSMIIPIFLQKIYSIKHWKRLKKSLFDYSADKYRL